MSLNITNIETCDRTWNPFTGCLGPVEAGIWGPNALGRCPFCYAHRLARGRLRQRYLSQPHPLAGDSTDPFAPRFWRELLTDPLTRHKPTKIFVVNMGDFCGWWVPRPFQEEVLDVERRTPQHTYQHFTKFGQELAKLNPWPRNAWVGISVSNQQMADAALRHLDKVNARVKFLSIEPMLGPIRLPKDPPINWLIVGAQTGPQLDTHYFGSPTDPPPETVRQWVYNLYASLIPADIPIYMKKNLQMPYQLQNWPETEKKGVVNHAN